VCEVAELLLGCGLSSSMVKLSVDGLRGGGGNCWLKSFCLEGGV
jgi:hypothetical protein